MELIDQALLDTIRRDGVLLQNDGADRYCYVYRQWRFFYSLAGPHAPEKCTDENKDRLPDYVERLLCKLERGYAILRDLFGLAEPLRGDLRFVDVVLEDIPTLHGVAHGRASEAKHALLADTPYAGRALKVRLHRGLIDQTATPQHELFHLYQYAYVPLINSWFMEGLATWFHRLFKNYAAREEDLPASADALSQLVQRKHDAEAFWNRLFRLCDDGQAAVPQPFRGFREVRQQAFPGRAFCRRLLEHLAELHATRRIPDTPALAGVDDRNLPGNNGLVFAAMLRAIDEMVPPAARSGELVRFIETITPFAGAVPAAFDSPPVRRLMADLQRHDLCPVLEHDGRLYSPCFDPLTGTLTVDTLSFRGAPPEGMACVRRIHGNVRIQAAGDGDCSALDAVGVITGALDISGAMPSLTGFAALAEVGQLVIERLPDLAAVSAFPELRVIKADLRISHCPQLGDIAGLDRLREIGGMLELGDLPALRDIRFLRALETAAGVVIGKCPIEDAAPLRLLFERNPDFAGGIRITRTAVTHVRFLSGLRSVGSSLYLSENAIDSIIGLEQLESVGASFTLAGNHLIDLTPLGRLRRVEGILSVSENNLASLAGLESLRRLRTKKWGDTPSTLRISGNPRLTDISAIAGIEASDHYLVLHLDQTQSIKRTPPPEAPFYDNILQVQDVRSGQIIPTGTIFARKPPHDGRHLRSALQNRWLECVIDCEGAADTLVIVFSGESNSRCWRVIDGLRAHKVVVADHRSQWYHAGLAGLSTSLAGTLDLLRGIAAARAYRQVVCVGAAAGGYMAMVTGWLIQADHVIAVNPHTCLDGKTLQRWGDGRFEAGLSKLPKAAAREYRDLNKLFAAHPNHRTRVHVHYDPASPLDQAHAMHLAERDGLFRHPLEGQGADADRLELSGYLALAGVLDDPFELIDSAAAPLAPETPRQMTLALNIAAWLFNRFRDTRFRVHMAGRKLRVPATGAILCPDIFVTRADAATPSPLYLEETLLVIEVLADANEAFNRGRRFDHFTRICGLAEYVTIDACTLRIRVWRPVGGQWGGRDLPAGQDLHLDSLGVAIPAAAVFANLP